MNIVDNYQKMSYLFLICAKRVYIENRFWRAKSHRVDEVLTIVKYCVNSLRPRYLL